MNTALRVLPRAAKQGPGARIGSEVKPRKSPGSQGG
jgi:hypothetical protein